MGHSVTKLVIFMIVALGLAGITGRPLEAASHLWVNPALSQLIEEGLTNNKELQSLEAKVESLKEEISFAGSLDDPRLGIGVINLPTDTFSFDQEAMTQKQIFVAQKVPWFGKLSLKEQRQALIAGRQQAILEARHLELARKIATNYYELGFIATSLEINRRLTEMVSQIIKVAETRYASGSGLQHDVLQAQVELSKFLDEKIMLQKKRRILEDRINELLNRESFIRIAPPKNLSDPKIRLDVETLKAISLRKNPWLRVRQFDVDRVAVEIDLAKKDYWPDMDFKVAYGQREEDFMGRDLPDLITASVVVNIPLWQRNRQDKKLEANRKNYKAATKSYESFTKSLPYRIDALATDIHDTQENYRLFSDALMIQAEQWARSSLSAYVVNKVEFNTMINAQMRLLRFELKSMRYLFNVYQKRAELEEILGGPLVPE
ncbi:MAG: TolC family protein [Deltaproteobacteria bacterium]|nr:TolC family protein [Deltaproteobacteria bacterium]